MACARARCGKHPSKRTLGSTGKCTECAKDSLLKLFQTDRLILDARREEWHKDASLHSTNRRVLGSKLDALEREHNLVRGTFLRLDACAVCGFRLVEKGRRFRCVLLDNLVRKKKPGDDTWPFWTTTMMSGRSTSYHQASLVVTGSEINSGDVK
jgi:hypothetical protein